MDDSIQALIELGFTGLEAEVYTALLIESPMTGYRIAQAIGKPAANTYKAIESLEVKGAILVDDGASRMCRPVPPEELLARLGRAFVERKERASQALQQYREAPVDDRVYQMRSREQVFERVRQMLERCREIAILDVFPQPLAEILADVESAARRGCSVAVKVYAPADIPGVEVIGTLRGDEVMERWPGEWLNIVVDGQEHLLAFLDRDTKGVIQAIWSGSAYLSWVYQSAVSSELMLAAVEQRMERGVSADVLRDEMERFAWLRATNAPGYQTLLRRFGVARTSDEVKKK